MSKKIKVCMIVQHSTVKGGIAAVINGYKGSSLEKEFDIRYVESYKEGSKMTKLLKGILGYIHFVKVLSVNRLDLVHIHSSFGASFYRKMPFIYMAHWAGIPVINHCHGADFERFYLNASKRKRNLIKKVYNKCSKIIALSEEWKQHLGEIVSPEKIEVIENYSILSREAVTERFARKSNHQVLFLGEIGKRKGCFDIPMIVEKVVTVLPEVKFVLAGAGEVERVKVMLTEIGVEHNVDFPGWVREEEKDKMLRESDVFFLPSYHEGMPMSILDAMGYGLPIVSTNVGGIPKLVINGHNGYICTPGDINAFAEKLLSLLQKEVEMKHLGFESYQIVQQNYALEKHLQKLSSLYHMIKTMNPYPKDAEVAKNQ
ncbi:MAG TPA: glycosyltransferase family 4 protein [Ureibacillus sp.]|nr:glycosyltransferase family 4 protein [Ureibacillus sp.]